MSAVISETFGKVAHPLLRIKMEANRKGKKKGVKVLILSLYQIIYFENSNNNVRMLCPRKGSGHFPACHCE